MIELVIDEKLIMSARHVRECPYIALQLVPTPVTNPDLSILTVGLQSLNTSSRPKSKAGLIRDENRDACFLFEMSTELTHLSPQIIEVGVPLWGITSVSVPCNAPPTYLSAARFRTHMPV